jgi:arylformamidase
MQLGARLNLRYGTEERHTLDLFLPVSRQPPPVVVYLHGGYWRANSKEDSSFVAAGFHDSGIGVAVLEYPLLPAVTMDQLVTDVRSGTAWVIRNAASLGIDRNRMYVAGHSSGAHLAAMLLAPGWQSAYGLPTDTIRGGCLLSGLFDLEPLMHTTVNEWARLDFEAALRNSPIRHPPSRLEGGVVVAYGSHETDEFRRQSQAYGEACVAAGVRTIFVELAGRNHYETAEELYRPKSVVVREVIAMSRRARRS